MSTYDVTVTREDGVWVVDIGGLPPSYFGMTQVTKFGDLDLEVRDLIAGLTEVEPDSFELTWRILFGEHDVTKLISEMGHLQRALTSIEVQRDDIRNRIIREGVGAELSQSVIADVLGVSQQRVGQLVRAS